MLPAGSHAYRIAVDGEEHLDDFNMHRLERPGELAVNLVEVPAAIHAGALGGPSVHSASHGFDGGAR
jgi:hypothetical protein